MKKILFLLMFSALLVSVSGVSAGADEVGDLFDDCMKRLTSGEVTLTISKQPDSTGFFEEAYVKGKGVVFRADGVDCRADSLSANVSGLQLNPPSEWKRYGEYRVKFNSFKSAALTVTVLESDINNALKGRELKFRADGKRFILSDIVVKITTSGIKITGNIKEDSSYGYDFNSYVAAWVLGAAADNYPVEINSNVRIDNNGTELWLDNPQVERGNFSQLDDYIQKNITQRNKPLLDLNKFDLSKTPITMKSVELQNGSLIISAGGTPQAITGGTTYTYPKSGSTTPTPTDPTEPIEAINLNVVDDTIRTFFANDPEVYADVVSQLGTLATDYPFKPESMTARMSGQTALTNEQLQDALGSDATWDNAYRIDTQSVSEAGTYILGSVKLPYEARTNMSLYMLTEESSGNFKIAANSGNLSDAAFFMNEDGEIIDEIPEDGYVIAVAPMKANVSYTPVIITTEEAHHRKNSSSDCNAGFGAIALVILALAFSKKF